MRFTFVVEVEVEREEGKFASRDEIREQIQEALESADPQSYDGENGGSYATTEWSVVEQEQPKPVRKPPKRVALHDGWIEADVEQERQDTIDNAIAEPKGDL